MKLITQEIRKKLVKNHKNGGGEPCLKLFNPCGRGTWILSEMYDDGDTLFGACDLGMGFPELGTVSLKELESVTLSFGLKIERDMWFSPKGDLNYYINKMENGEHC